MAIDLANQDLDNGEKIAESLDLRRCKNIEEAIQIVSKHPGYRGSKYTSFTISDKEMARALEKSADFRFTVLWMK